MKKSVWFLFPAMILMLFAACQIGEETDGWMPSPGEEASDKGWDTVTLPNGLVEAPIDQATHVVLGMSTLDISSASPIRIGVQVDRGIRDIADVGMWYDERVPPDRIPASGAELVPYMEGLRAAELMDWTGSSVYPLGPCKAIRKATGYYEEGVADQCQYFYGPDGQGSYPFYILADKIAYKTTAFSAEGGETYATVVDTHGFSAVASKAYEMKTTGGGLDLAIACMDFPDKADAAYYLAQNGIACYAPCDRYAYTLLSRVKSAPPSAVILGSAPVTRKTSGARIGGQPVAISLSETVIAQYTNREYPYQYYDAPSRYFDEFRLVYPRCPKVIKVSAVQGQAKSLVNAAKKYKATVIAARVYSRTDYTPLRSWVAQDSRRRLVLFHSAAYEYGIKLLREFPSRVTFGDLRPVFAK